MKENIVQLVFEVCLEVSLNEILWWMIETHHPFAILALGLA